MDCISTNKIIRSSTILLTPINKSIAPFTNRMKKLQKKNRNLFSQKTEIFQTRFYLKIYKTGASIT